MAWLRAFRADPKQATTMLLGSLLTSFWSHIEGPVSLVAEPSLAPSDNLQTAMNLIMPLRYPGVVMRAELGNLLAQSLDEILAGLNNVGTIHFARFDIIQGNLCMFSIFDGDFYGYIRDFIGVIGEAFDGIMEFVQDPPTVPCQQNVDEFVDWIKSHDSLQMPQLRSDVTADLLAIERQTLILLQQNRNVQLGLYRGYPGYSVAQIRDGLGIGW